MSLRFLTSVSTLPARAAFRDIGYPAIVGIAAVAMYAVSWSHDLVWDDEFLITSHRGVAGADSPWRVLTPGYYERVYYRGAAFYRPVTTLTFAAEYALWSRRPNGYHVTNTVIYGVCLILVYHFLRRLTASDGLAFMASLLFLVHATHAETVLWVKCRAEMFAFLGYLGSLLCFLASLEPSRIRRARVLGTIAAVLLFLLAMGAKISAITLPAAVSLTLLWRKGNGRVAKRLLPTWPLWLCAAVYGALDYGVFNRVSAAAPLNPGDFGLLPVFARVMASVWAYLRMTVWPGDLTIWRDLPAADWSGFRWAWPFLAALVVVGVLLLWFRHRSGWVGYGIAWYGITMAPIINLVRITGRAVAEQRLFLPSVGICLAAASVLRWVWMGGPQGRLRTPGRVTAGLLVVLYAGVHLGWVRSYLPAWRTEETFWREALRRHPESAVAHDLLGAHLARVGRTQEALEHVQMARALDPNDIFTLLHEGIVLNLSGNPADAAAVLEEVVGRRPDLPEAQSALARVRLRVGDADGAARAAAAALDLNPRLIEASVVAARAAAELRRWPEALEAARRVLVLAPEDPDNHVAVVRLLHESGDREGALDAIQGVLRSLPGHAPAMAEAARLLHDGGRYDESIRYWEGAIAREPRAEWYNGLGKSLLMLQGADGAVAAQRKAVALSPEKGAYQADLAEALMVAGELVEAASHYRGALRTDPEDGTVWGGLGVCLAQLGDLEEALPALERAVNLEPGNPDLWRNRGLALLNAHRTAAAVGALETSARLDPEAAASWRLLAQAYVAAGSPEQASQAARRAQGLEGFRSSPE